MKDTVLLVGHGSRQPAGNQEIEAFTGQWRAALPHWRIELCFIEFADINLDKGLDLAAANSGRVVVVPLILNAAGHVKMEIPTHMEEARQRHHKVEFVYAAQLGACDELLEVLQRRLKSGMAELDMPDPRTTGVVVLGRGSSDRGANGEVAKIARWLQETGDHDLIDIAFTGITYPRLESVIQRQAKLGMTQVVVLPYYLFAGTLMTRIERQVENLKAQYPQIRFARTDYFGFEPEIAQLLEQRVLDAGGGAALPCDGCSFRVFAQEHGMGHHHHHEHGPEAVHEHTHEHSHAEAVA